MSADFINDVIEKYMDTIKKYAREKYDTMGPGITKVIFNRTSKDKYFLCEQDGVEFSLDYEVENDIHYDIKNRLNIIDKDKKFVLQCLQFYTTHPY